MIEDKVYCRDCGEMISKKAEICPNCGVRQKTRKVKDKTVAGLLAIFLGGLGVHKFYLRRTAWGIAYLLFFWTYIPAIVGFIEGIRYLVMNEESFNKKYNSGE